MMLCIYTPVFRLDHSTWQRISSKRDAPSNNYLKLFLNNTMTLYNYFELLNFLRKCYSHLHDMALTYYYGSSTL